MALMKIIENDKISNVISKAFVDVINVFFIKEKIAFNVTILKPLPTSYEEVVDKTLTKMNKTQPIFIRNIDILKEKYFITSLSTVFFIDYVNALQNITRVVSTDPRNLKFLIYATNCFGIDTSTTSILLHNLKFPKNIEISLYSYFFCREKNNLMLMTWEWYTSKKSCKERKFRILNRFNMMTKKWERQLTNHIKFHDFRQCDITIFYPSQFFHKRDKTGKMRDAFEPFWKEVAKYANFKLKLTPERKKRKHLEITNGGLSLDNQNISITSIFWSMNIGLVITKGERYTQYEKLMLPFDAITWILLIFTFSTAFLTIFFVNRLNKEAQNTVFGEGVNVPSLNVVSTFLGISQAKMPKKTFARFILLLFIFFCLIFRTAYQGVLFDLMNADMRKPHAKTIAEVFEKNYKVLSYKTHEGIAFKESIKPEWREKVDETSVITNRIGVKALCYFLEKDESNIAIVMHEPVDIFAEFICKRKLLKIQETVFNIPQGFGMPQNHYLYSVTDKLIPKMFEAGMMKHFYDIWLHWRFLKDHFYEYDKPKALTVKDLGYGFNIFLITCAFTIMIFFMEIFVWKFKIYIKKRKEKLNSIQNENNEAKVEEINEDSTEIEELVSNLGEQNQNIQKEFVEEPNEIIQNCSIEENKVLLTNKSTQTEKNIEEESQKETEIDQELKSDEDNDLILKETEIDFSNTKIENEQEKKIFEKISKPEDITNQKLEENPKVEDRIEIFYLENELESLKEMKNQAKDSSQDIDKD
ncbi:hypothetical protein PVAND_000995 [Polypedilum vanderplanki]|uniref:Ionotropic glutamate receptor C-terminal domain-containing protein n=1 Tax=Polypedilum vanderplanki TaxID=319348 RepID=A0A9J6BLW1_POLVA|nr:hypothetical protein PVAND_000995 [Polypedilum vanderplanki]